MQVTAPLRHSLQDEHVIGIDPPLKPDLPGIWRRRINPFIGRAISDKALTAEQDMRAGLQRLNGLGMTSGIVEGLQLTAEQGALGQMPADAWIRISPGLGVARSGEDLDLGSGLQVSLAMLPVIVTASAADALAGRVPSPAPPDVPPDVGPARDGEPLATRLMPGAPRTLTTTLGEVIANPAGATLPHVGIVVAQPVGATILGRPADDCPPDPRDDPYADLQRIDGGRLLLYLWPSEMVARMSGPDYSLPALGPALRNQLAYRIFDVERGFLAGEMHPWEDWGLPLALVGFDTDWKLAFIDRSSVVRRGGQPLPRTPMVPQSGNPALWQARIDQLVEHLGALPDLADGRLRSEFQRVPPVGVLPATIYDSLARRQHFFPSGFGVDAIPIPRTNLDLALHEAASLAPFNLSVPDRVEMLIPVADPAYEPGLLQTAAVDPRFAVEIADAEADRERWLNRREQIRRRYERLIEAATGTPASWPGDSLAAAELLPVPATNPPLIAARTRRFAAGAAASAHSVEMIASLSVARGDTLWFWVRVQDATGLTGLSLRLATPDKSAIGEFVYAYGVYWGAPDPLAISGITTSGLAARRVGDLPSADGWYRLDVSADHAWTVPGNGAAGQQMAAVEFAQRGGDVEWGPFGKDDASGNSTVWIGNEAPPAVFKVNNVVAPWLWADVADRSLDDLARYGTSVAHDIRTVDDLEAFKQEWPQTVLQADIARLDETGLDAYLDLLDAQLKATNDAIDLGFVRARSDIYRVRQFMLGGDAASRLVTSPSLADLAVRDEGARATSAGISKFIADAVSRTPSGIAVLTPTPGPPPPPPPPPPATNGGSFAGVNNGTTFNNVFSVAKARPFATTSFLGANTAMATVSMASVRASSVVTPAITSFLAPQASPVTALNLARGGEFLTPVTVAQASLSTGRYVPNDVRAQRPIAGLIERTISVAERLTPSPAVQALEYAIASKAAVLQTVRALNTIVNGRTRGVATDDIVVPGFALKTPSTPPPTVALLFADQALAATARQYIDQDVMPDAGNKHESDYFTAAVNAIDNAIALMRLVEGRVSLFQGLADRVREVRDGILGVVNVAGSELRSIDVELAEARHDLATAQALLTEETARVDALNARRQATLADVNVIAYRRVRECDSRDAAPTQEILSGLAETPVAACRREHPDTPPEIALYVGLLRDAPVKWFPQIAQAVAKIDRIDAALAALQFSRQFALAMASQAEFLPAEQIRSAPRFLAGALKATRAQYQTLAMHRGAVAQLDLTAINRFSLTQYHAQIREASTLGDLAQGANRNAQLTRMASDLVHGVAELSACLHAEFAEVPPVARLAWAELLSGFDQPADLRHLGGLPDWGEVELAQRHTLQGLVDWLFAQIDQDDDKARAMINDLVRIALLLAAHSPVDRLVPARLVTDSPARIGSRLPLLVDSTQARIGMVALIRDRSNAVISRAVIEDLADGRASARIIHTVPGVSTIASAMRIDLASSALRFGN